MSAEVSSTVDNGRQGRMLPVDTADDYPVTDSGGDRPWIEDRIPPPDVGAETLPAKSNDTLPTTSVITLPVQTVDTLPEEEYEESPGETANTLPEETVTHLPAETINTLPEEAVTTLPEEDPLNTPPEETVTTLPDETIDNQPSEEDLSHSRNLWNLWPNEKYSSAYTALPGFIVRLYTEEIQVDGSRKSPNKLSARNRCRSTPTAEDLAKLEKAFVNDAILTERKRTKYKDIIPPYDATADKNARSYFMRRDVQHLLRITRSAR